jgi:hypothetical protein
MVRRRRRGCRNAWHSILTDHLLGRLDARALLARAHGEAAGPRARARRLHEAHVLLALRAHAAGDTRRERHHLHAAAARGDMGGPADAWIHARALGAPVVHRPPRPLAADAPGTPAILSV